MSKYQVSVVRYERPYESVKKAVELCSGLEHVNSNSKVFIKPNIVFWTKTVPFPKWGVITTSQVIHDVVLLLAERGVTDITIGEGTVVYDPKDFSVAAHAFDTLGYDVLKNRYGVKVVNVFERAFKKVDLGDGISLNFNQDFLDSDFLVNVPVMKTHAQTVVSLGIKNIKGLIDINSRKKCHSAVEGRDLHYYVAKLGLKIPEGLTLIDGIFTNERGPAFDGKIRRSNILVASRDTFAADKTAARLLGFDAREVPHFGYYSEMTGRSLDYTDIVQIGEQPADLGGKFDYTFPYLPDNSLPIPMAKMGISGLSYPKFDLTMCTYCSILTGLVLFSIAQAWKGEPFEDVEILTGKTMKPTSGKKHTLLLGKCMYEANKTDPAIQHLIAVKSCPPKPEDVVEALHSAGIHVEPALFADVGAAPGFYLRRYKDKPEYDENLFSIS